MPAILRLQPLSRYGAVSAVRNLSIWLILAGFLILSPLLAKAQPVTIAVLGDSLVHGYGLQPEDGFVMQMQRWLEANGSDVTLINAGVSGDTTAGGLSRIEWTLTPEVDAIVVSLGGNDVLRGIDPATARANLDAILTIAEAKSLPMLLIGIQAPGNYGLDYKLEFEAIYPALAAKHSAALYPNFLQALTALPDQSQTLQTYFQSDGLHPNPKGVALIVDDMGPSFADLAKAPNQP